jgi:hypothetical protein
MASRKSRKKHVTFKKADFMKFASKMEEWGKTLPPEEQVLLIAVLDKGSRGIRAAGDDVIQTTTTVSIAAAEFDLGQFLVELLLALKGITAEVEEDGPSWIEEITVGKT